MVEEEMEETAPLETPPLEPPAEGKGRNISIYLPNDLIEKCEKYAESKGLKRSQVVAKALEEGLGREDRLFKKLDYLETLIKKQNPTPSKTETEEPTLTNEEREKLETLLKDCTEFGGFEIEDEHGFKALCQERGLIGEVWTEEYLTKVAEKLKIGYDGYLIKPLRHELINDCAKAMKLNEEQKEILSEEFNDLFVEEASEEEEAEEKE